MSGPEILLPLPDDVVKYRNLLFNLDSSVILNEELYWPLVNNIYSHHKTYFTLSGRKTKYYECRLVKSRPSRTTR